MHTKSETKRHIEIERKRERDLLTLTSDIKQEKNFENLFLLAQNMLKRNARRLKSKEYACKKKKESI